MDTQLYQHPPKPDRSRTKWTPTLDNLFVDLVLEQVQQGNRSDNVFNKIAWKHIRDVFNKQTGLDFNRKQLKKHLDVLRNRFYSTKSQFDQSGLVGDVPKSMLITGADVWDDYIEPYPIGEPTRIKDCPYYEQLCKIFSESGGIGRYAQSSHYIGLDKELGPSQLSAPTVPGLLVDTAMPSPFVQDDSSPRSGIDGNLEAENNHNKATAPSSCNKRKRKRYEFDDNIPEAILEMAAASKMRTNAIIHRADQFSITKCVKLLDELPELEESLYFKAVDLFDSPNLREIFVSLKSHIRLKWLQHKCN
ncbi:hypothetical protein Sjap_010032 [Stephania japonica]|uniref:Myb/SANT-like domain-containing protein n=1 Tax=Stephania japonica TaxID=461633 RepID=A0AAP0J9M7_9MAGN